MPIGPVQLLVVAFDEPAFSGEILDELKRLREKDVIRLIDAMVVQKGLDGTLVAVQLSDLSIARWPRRWVPSSAPSSDSESMARPAWKRAPSPGPRPGLTAT